MENNHFSTSHTPQQRAVDDPKFVPEDFGDGLQRAPEHIRAMYDAGVAMIDDSELTDDIAASAKFLCKASLLTSNRLQ